MGRKGLSHLTNVAVGTGNNEVISIWAVRKSSDWGNMETKMLNSIGEKHAPWGTPALEWNNQETVELYRQLVVRHLVVVLKERCVSIGLLCDHVHCACKGGISWIFIYYRIFLYLLTISYVSFFAFLVRLNTSLTVISFKDPCVWHWTYVCWMTHTILSEFINIYFKIWI